MNVFGHERASHYQRHPGVAPSALYSCNISTDNRGIRDIIRDVVRSELKKLFPAAERPASLSIAELVREEVRAFQPKAPVDALALEEPTMSYTVMARRPPPPARPYVASLRRDPPVLQYSQRHEEQAQYVRPEPPAPMKTDVWLVIATLFATTAWKPTTL